MLVECGFIDCGVFDVVVVFARCGVVDYFVCSLFVVFGIFTFV